MNEVTLLTLQAVHASAMLGLCADIIENAANADDRRLACEVRYDARHALAQAREGLVDLGADLRRATVALLGLDEL